MMSNHIEECLNLILNLCIMMMMLMLDLTEKCYLEYVAVEYLVDHYYSLRMLLLTLMIITMVDEKYSMNS